MESGKLAPRRANSVETRTNLALNAANERPKVADANDVRASRRDLLIGGAGLVAASAMPGAAIAADAPVASRAMDIQESDTAVVFIDPQNDVLSKQGANWGRLAQA